MCFKMIFGKAVKENLEIEQLDMDTAFFNSLIVNGLLIYIEQSADYRILEYLIYFLLYTLYS